MAWSHTKHPSEITRGQKLPNERLAENLVRKALEANGYFEENSDILVEEQSSEVATIQRGLKKASKTGNGGKGSPEFIITNPEHPDFVIVVECKAKTSQQKSVGLDRPKDFAVDGALHYSRFLSSKFNVIGIGFSGDEAQGTAFDAYLTPKGTSSAIPLLTKAGAEISEFIPWDDFVEHASFDPSIQRLRFEELMEFARELHDFMRDHMKLIESEKPLIVSGTLIALRDPAFAAAFEHYKPDNLQKQWARVIREQIEAAEIPNAKKLSMVQPYASIAVHPELGKPTGKTKQRYPKGVLNELVSQLNQRVWPFMSIYHDFDVVGQFYGEFLKYTGGDKKALGIVLTPRHITELFSLIANVKKDSRVLDLCAGTGGFLISAMHQMMRDASTKDEEKNIREKGLIGVEQQPNMYALAASNMILRGDGKANLHQGSCFDDGIVKAVKEHKCDVGMINPPYSQGDEDLHELVFVEHMLNCLEKGGIGIGIVPISCAISPHPLKKKILEKHTLKAVMSMPQEVFYPVGVVTCIMVFEAHKPHSSQKGKTWFGFWREDGFVKTKHRGRIDLDDNWLDIRRVWLDGYFNSDEVPGLSVKHKVGAEDEWCAEAYMETDYSDLSAADFENEIRKYAAFRILNGGDLADD